MPTFPVSRLAARGVFAAVVALCVCPCLARFAAAQDVPMQRLESAKKNPDFALLGEFVGPVDLGDARYERLGVQVRAMGGGNFEALQYLGGLPGEPGFRNELVSLLGRRAGAYLILSGGPWALLVHPDHCVVVNDRGDRIGRLERLIRTSPTLGAQPPDGATVLFDGSSLEQFTSAKMTDDGLLMEGAQIKPMFQDFNLHVEFRTPFKPEGRGQDRGNSGLYLQSRYEVQVLESFAEPPTINGLGALYQYRAPDLNMSLPPLVWQTYDIVFTAPRWAADGTKTRNARITVWLNGVKVQDDQELTSKTGAGREEEPNLLPIYIQNHGNPVRFRNMWIVDRGLYTGQFPVYPPAAPEEEPKTEDPEESPAESQEQPQEEEKEQESVDVTRDEPEADAPAEAAVAAPAPTEGQPAEAGAEAPEAKASEADAAPAESPAEESVEPSTESDVDAPPSEGSSSSSAEAGQPEPDAN